MGIPIIGVLFMITSVWGYTPKTFASRGNGRRVASLTMSSEEVPEWTQKLLKELENAASMAERGATVSDVLKQAKLAADEGAKAAAEDRAVLSQRVADAESRAAKALRERDDSIARAAAAEDGLAKSKSELDNLRNELSSAQDNLDQLKKDAAEEMGRLDDAFEFEQNRVMQLKREMQMAEMALAKAEKEKKLANLREASAAADAEASAREKTAVELALEEERIQLEGCLVDAQSAQELALCRASEAENELDLLRLRVGRKRRVVRNAVRESTTKLNALLANPGQWLSSAPWKKKPGAPESDDGA